MTQKAIRFYAVPELFNVQLVHGMNVDHRFPRHIHSSFLLGMIEQGERIVEIQGESFTIKSGECFLLKPFEPHLCSVSTTEPHDYWALSIETDQMQKIFEDIRGTPASIPMFSQQHVREPSLFLAMQAFVTAVEKNEELFLQDSLFREVMRLCVIRDIEERVSLKRINSYAVTRVREYLEQHFDEKIRLEDLAAFGRISPFYLTRIFQQEIGVPPYEYLVKLRLKHAQRFLKAGESIAGTAYRTGFSDQSHFSRFFKRHVGLTPGKFVRTC